MINCLKGFIKLFIYSTVPLFITWKAHAQQVTFADAPGNTTYALRVDYGVIYAHTKFVENTAGAHPAGIEFEYSKQLTSKRIWNYYRCYPRTGLVFSYFNFNTPILGRSYSVSYFIEPNYRISNNAVFFLRTAAGLSYLTNPHDSLKNPTNQSYSLPVNCFLSVGVGLNYRVSRHVALSFMASFQHNSNGGFQLPNHGVNFPTASVGVKYSIRNNGLPVYKRENIQSFKHSGIAVDAGMFYSPKSGYNPGWVSQRKYLAGAFVQFGKRVSTLDAITVSAEFYHDNAMASIKKMLGDNSSNDLAGIMVGHEFVFRRIFFSQQLGYYIYKNTATFSNLYQQSFPALYHRWGLRYKLNQHWFAGFNMLAHKQVADFVDVRLSYRF